MHRSVCCQLAHRWAKMGGCTVPPGVNLKLKSFAVRAVTGVRSLEANLFRSKCRLLATSASLHQKQDDSDSDFPQRKVIDENVNIQQLIIDAKIPDSTEGPPEFPSDVEKSINDRRRDQTRGSFRPRVNPEETSVLLFPGQGSQFVGMGKNLVPIPKVREIYATANKILGYDLLDMCLNGPKEELDKTVHCQPAVFVTSLAAVEKLKEENEQAIVNCTTAAGFSVGEYAALVFAGSISFEDALRVVEKRAKAMQEASEQIPSGMMTAFLGAGNKAKMAAHTASLFCTRELGMEPESVDCIIANYLYPGCKVYAGNIEALDFIAKHFKDFGIKRVKHLPVSGAFHSKLMQPAVETLHNALTHVKLSPPIISVHNNVDTKRYYSSRDIVNLLTRQVVSPVKWEQLMHKIYERKKDMEFPKSYEVGPGRQLGAMLKMNNNQAYQNYRPVDV